MTQLPILSLAQPADEFAQAIGKSFQQTGFALVTDHGLDPDLVSRGWAMTQAFFAQDEAEKRLYADKVVGNQRGYIPFGREIAKDAKVHDLKEFWHVGRDVAPNDPDAATMPPNIWPDAPQGFRGTLSALYAALDQVGATILSRIALYLGLADDWFDGAIHNGNSILRLLHYPPIIDAPEGAIRAGAHEDINLITLLLGAEEAGLQLLTRENEWIDASPPEGALVINVGDMLQRLTNHHLPSTTHRVINPASERSRHSRYSMPFFLHLRSDFPIKTLDQCISADNPNRYPEPILADDYLHERLVEIGLIKA
ncbi:isopenicillin N synthase family dioxygenase [Parasphingorhabdus sp. DH2-15]|uniref:isopenicillin N synthase family dioxygenase n=1 Tax=Parasphingorhabdus sp. DH2-15 TaxID=3444112 RepID=UPI003F68500D